MKSFIKSTINLTKFNIKTMVAFSFVYVFLTFAIFDLCLRGAVVLAMKACNITYLGDNTILTFIANPITWICIIISASICSYLCLIYNSSISYVLNLSKNKKKARLNETISVGLNKSLKAFKLENILLIPYVLCLIPFVDTIEVTSQSLSVGIPGFIMDAIMANKLYLFLLIVVLLFLVILNLNLTLSLPAFFTKDYSFKEAANESYQLMKNNKKRFVLYYVVGLLFIIVPAIIIVVFIYFGFELLFTLFSLRIIKTIRLFLIAIAVSISIALLSITKTSLNVNFYFLRNAETGIVVPEEEKYVNKESLLSLLTIVVALASIVVSFLWSTNSQIAHTKRIIPEIAAHRGDSVRAPENSLPAFKLAVEENISSWVELDVHQTKDGVIIVSHDDYLGRIGIDRYVHDSTYEELIKYDSGAWFSNEYKGLHLCTLKEALELMKDKVSVQIEIKPTDYDDHIEESVLSIIDEVNSCLPNVVLSMSDKPLKRIKEISEDSLTIYCTIIASKGIEYLDYADWFSIEESCISKELVNSIHAKGKKCFVWTINKEENVQKLVDDGVDVILTDDPIMMRNALLKCDYSETIENDLEEGVSKLFEFVENILTGILD